MSEDYNKSIARQPDYKNDSCAVWVYPDFVNVKLWGQILIRVPKNNKDKRQVELIPYPEAEEIKMSGSEF